MTSYNDSDPLPQSFRGPLQRVLLRCVDMAETPSDKKAMILTMYESGMLSPSETFAHIASRGLQSA